MIDLKAARHDPEGYRAALARKGAAETFDAMLEADERWRALVPRIDELRSRTKLKGKPSPEQLAELQSVKEELRAAEEELAAAEAARDELALRVPNPPAADTPDGSTEEDVEELRRVGEPSAGEGAREHVEVGRFDMERAARMSGARFGYWIGDTARLALALYRLALDRLAADGFVTVLPPVLVREEALIGTGAFPSDQANVYELPADGLYLAGTAEIPLASLHAGEILETDELPLRYVAFSPCFRREAGAAGRDTRGMIRVHQFNKVEQFSSRDQRTPGTSTSSYSRTPSSSCASSDFRTESSVSRPATSRAPPRRPTTWRSGSRARVAIARPPPVSNTTDYQARRLGIRHRGERGVEPVHTLNGTAVVDRMALAILENLQGEVPDVLKPFGAPDTISR